MRPYDVGFAVVAALFVFFVGFWLLGGYDAADVRQACATHTGVQQVMDGGPTTQVHVNALVVCRDGSVQEIR